LKLVNVGGVESVEVATVVVERARMCAICRGST
jgi:hypothetical protein